MVKFPVVMFLIAIGISFLLAGYFVIRGTNRGSHSGAAMGMLGLYVLSMDLLLFFFVILTSPLVIPKEISPFVSLSFLAFAGTNIFVSLGIIMEKYHEKRRREE